MVSSPAVQQETLYGGESYVGAPGTVVFEHPQRDTVM